MNLIYKSEEEIKKLSEKLHRLKKFGLTKTTLIETLNDLMTDTEKKYIKYSINDNIYPICFEATDGIIYSSLEKLKQMIIYSIKSLKRIFPNLDENEMFNYYVLFALTHELRHVKQYLITEEFIDAPYKIIKEVYKTIFKIGDLNINPLKNFIITILYNLNSDRYVIERTANIETSEILKTLAEYEENTEIANVFNEVRQKNIMYGYDDRYNGSIEETYKRLHLTPFYKNLPVGEAIPVRDRILYGLPINEETKKKVLEKRY